MSDRSVAVVDANVLLNLATPVVDARPETPSGADPLKAVLTTYDVHAPDAVLGEVADAAGDDDRLAAAAELVLHATQHLTTHDVSARTDDPLGYGLDRGESAGSWLANELGADLFVTDEFNTTNYLFVALGLEDRNTLFTTPHVLCTLATHGILPEAYVSALLPYYVETKGWDGQYVERLRQEYLSS